MSNLSGLIHQHMAWYPLMEPRDIYKLIYQGVRGAEHFITSSDEFSACLVDEFDRLSSNASERLTEPVCPDGTILRINLRPFKALADRVDRITPFLLRTASDKTCFTGDLKAAWQEFILACQTGEFPNFDLVELKEFNSRLEALDYPAIHHSETYSREYQPAYRLIAERYLHELGLDLEG